MRIVELRSDMEGVLLRSDAVIRNVEPMFKFGNSTLGKEVRSNKKSLQRRLAETIMVVKS